MYPFLPFKDAISIVIDVICPSSCTFHKLSLSCSNQFGNTFESQEKSLDIRESGQSKCSSFLLTHILVGSRKRPDLDTLLQCTGQQGPWSDVGSVGRMNDMDHLAKLVGRVENW